MAQYRTGKFIRALEKKGFRQDKTHHFMFWFYFGTKKTSVHTWISKGEKKFEGNLVSERKKQIKLKDESDFKNFYECPMELGQYENYLVREGHVSP